MNNADYEHFIKGVTREDSKVGSFIEYTDGTKLFVADAQYRKKCNWYKARNHCDSIIVSGIPCSLPAMYKNFSSGYMYHELKDIFKVGYQIDSLDESPKGKDKYKLCNIYENYYCGAWSDISIFDMWEEERHGCCYAYNKKMFECYPISKKASCVSIPCLRVGCKLRHTIFNKMHKVLLERS